MAASMTERTSRAARVGAVALLLLAGFAIQLYYLRSYPQPILFGDPGAYYVVGQKMAQAIARLLDGESVSSVYESIRGLLYFAGVGSLYGLIDSLSPQNIPYFRVVLSLFNTVAMLGVFFLARRLSSCYAGGLIGLALAVSYPPFAVQTGRLFPDPVTGCLFVWATYFYLRGVQEKSAATMAAAGAGLTLALFVRSQLFNYVMVLLVVTLVATMRWWWPSKKLIGALLLGAAPVTLLWMSIVAAVGDDLEQIEAFGNFTFQQRYPYGFWQFLDTDGFMGPYRLTQEPYYRALEAEAVDDPAILESRSRQLLFTADYVWSRRGESALMLLDNVYRLYDRPANDYKWDYLFAYPRQVIYQKIVLVGAFLAFAVYASMRGSAAFVFFVPACLALLHALSYPWPRFNQPAMPILIAAAGAFVPWAWNHRENVLRRSVLFVLALGLAVLIVGELLRMTAPELSHWLRLAATLSLIGAPFVFVAAPWEHRGRTVFAFVSWILLASLVTAHEARSVSWHETSTRAPDVVQEIALSQTGLQKLRRASEAFVVLDLLVPNGDPAGVEVTIGDRAASLTPTMPRFGESTAAGGRNRREYRQWWATPLLPEDLPASAPAVLQIGVNASERRDVILYGDRFRDQTRRYEGPSFGDWPHLAQVKLEYDGDYRLPYRRELQSAGTTSDTGGIYRIRIVTLARNEGELKWASTPLSEASPAAFAFHAYSGKRGTARLFRGEQELLDFPLAGATDFDVEAAPYRLCYRADAPRGELPYGGFVFFSESEPEGPIPLTVRFTSGMSVEPMFMSLDQRDRAPSELASLLESCGGLPDGTTIVGFGEVTEAVTNSYPADTGRWTVRDVF